MWRAGRLQVPQNCPFLDGTDDFRLLALDGPLLLEPVYLLIRKTANTRMILSVWGRVTANAPPNPALFLNCPIKSDFRISAAGARVFPPLLCRNRAEHFGNIREYEERNGVCIGHGVAHLWEEPARGADVSRPLRRLCLLPGDRVHARRCRPPTASLTCWMSETGTRCAEFQRGCTRDTQRYIAREALKQHVSVTDPLW